MDKSEEKKITIVKDGPYIVSGDIPLTVEIITNNNEGYSWDWKKGKKIQDEAMRESSKSGLPMFGDKFPSKG